MNTFHTMISISPVGRDAIDAAMARARLERSAMFWSIVAATRTFLRTLATQAKPARGAQLAGRDTAPGLAGCQG
jgi:hypothetical protein